jgi:amino acid transporter
MIWPAFSFLFAVLSTAFGGEIKNVERGQLIGIAGAQLVGGLLVLLTGLFARLAIGTEGLLAAGWVSAVTPENFPFPYPWLTLLASIMADNILLTVVINLTAVIMITYVAASTAIYATRGLLAWGIDGMGPAKLGEVSERYRSPTYAILTTVVVGTIILAVYSFTDWLLVLNGLAAMGIVFLITTIAGMIFPFTHRETYEASPAKIEVAGIPLMTLTGIIGTVGVGFIVYRGLFDADYGANRPASLGIVVGVFVVGIIWYFVARAVRRSQGVDMGARFEEIPIE